MTVRRIGVAAACAAAFLAAAPAALAQEQSKLVIGGTTYTKWLWGNQRHQGSLYNFTTVPGEGYGDNGQGSEVELLLSARLSKKVEVRARIHSRFSQNFWTNFGGFGGRNPALEDPPAGPCVEGDCGEFDPRSNQYVKLRGVAVTLTPGYRWIDSATIGANDFGQFDPFVLGRIRYIDRDNAAGLLFQGSALGRKLTWDAARVSLPRLWAGPNFNTGDFHAADAAYDVQARWEVGPAFDLGVIAQYVNDMEIDSDDNIFDDGRNVRTRFRNSVGGVKLGIRPGSKIELSGRYYQSSADSVPIAGAPAGFGAIAGFSSTLAGKRDPVTDVLLRDGEEAAWRFNADFSDPFDMGLSFNLEVFDIGSDYVSMMAARRESDVLLTEGHDGAWAFPGPSNAAFGVFGGVGNQTRIGYGGWNGNAAQVATINVDNEFTDFDEQMAETVIGWRGVTLVPSWSSGSNDIAAEITFVDYNTNWQAFGLGRMNNVAYPTAENDSGVGHNFRSAYAPFQDKETMIALLKGKHVLDFGPGLDFFWKVKYIDETDDRLTDASWLTNPEFTGLFSPPPVITVPETGATGFQWAPFDDVTDDDRDLEYWLYSAGIGYQIHDDLYTTLQYERFDVDLLDGNTAFQGYNLHEMVSGDHEKNNLSLRARYVMGGAEMGLVYEYVWGTFTPDFGDGFVTQFADAGTATNNFVPLGSPGFRGRFGGWNSLLEREFRQNRIKAFMKVQF
jgi:hypothetical protein